MVKTVVKIDGMMCGMCEAHVNDAIRNNFQVRKVKASKRKKEAIVTSEQALDVDKMKGVIDGTGYTFLSMEEQ